MIGPTPGEAGYGLAERLVALLAARGSTVAVAESLTGGWVQTTLTSIAGVSAVFRGGVVAYATDLKQSLLGIPAGVLAADGAVAAITAEQMATNVARVCGADWGMATTGVAGPDPQEGHLPGTVFVAVAGNGQVCSQRLDLHGDRAEVRIRTVEAVLRLLVDRLQ